MAASFAQGAIIAQWNFNGASATTVPGGTSAPTVSVGTGTASLGGSVTSPSFNSGVGSSDPIVVVPTNYGWQTTTYGAASSTELVNGPRFDVSTVGQNTVKGSFDLRFSNSSSRYGALQYTTNGTTWTTARFFNAAAGSVQGSFVGDTWVNNITFDLSAVPAVNNNANFGIRMVNAYESTATGAGVANFVAANTGNAYATGGTWRFDMVTVDAIPEPSSTLFGALGMIALLRRRR